MKMLQVKWNPPASQKYTVSKFKLHDRPLPALSSHINWGTLLVFFDTEQANNTALCSVVPEFVVTNTFLYIRKKKTKLLYKSNVTLRTFTHLRLSLTSDVEDTVPEVAVVMAVVVAVAFTTDGATGTVTAVGTLSFSFSVLSSAHKRFEVLQHNEQQTQKKRKGNS